MPVLLKTKIKEILSDNISPNEICFNSTNRNLSLLFCDDYKKYTFGFFEYLKQHGSVS